MAKRVLSKSEVITDISTKINDNLYSIKIASANSVDKISTKVSELEEKNTALETRIAELENIISQIQNK